jgi:hypothetical protein
MADTLILLQSEGWFIQDIEAHANIHPCKAVVRLRLKRPKKNTTSVYRI